MRPPTRLVRVVPVKGMQEATISPQDCTSPNQTGTGDHVHAIRVPGSAGQCKLVHLR